MDSDTLVTSVADNGSTVTESAATGGAFSMSAALGLFNIIVGLMIVAAFLLFFGGFIGYITRLGLVGREQGLHYMNWGVTVLFVLIILIGIVQYFQRNPQAMFAVVGFAISAAVLWLVFKAMQDSGSDEEH